MSSVRLSNLSVTECTVAKQYILQHKCLNKSIGNAPLGTRFCNFQPPTLTVSPQTPHSQNFQILLIYCVSVHHMNILFILLRTWKSIVIEVIINYCHMHYDRLSQQHLGFLFEFCLLYTSPSPRD